MSNLEKEINLRQFTYHGIVLSDKDELKKQGRYKVHIPELHTLIKSDSGIWCKNQQQSWRWTPSHDYMYGEYYPIQPGTKVLIRFYENDFHTGYIDRILSDQVKNTTPKIGCELNPEASADRDDMYLIYKTPKKHNLFLVLEDTQDSANGLNKQLIPNSIHLYYNYRRSTFIINEDGIHWFTMDNYGVTIEGNYSKWVNKTEKVFIKESRDLYVDGSYSYTYIKGDEHRISDGERRDYSKSQMSLISSEMIAEDAPSIWLNSGKSSMAKKAKVNKGEDEIIKQKKIDMRVSPHQKKDDTYYGIEKYKIEGGSPNDNHPDPAAVRLSKGMNDRYSSIGAQQCGAPMAQVIPYPPGEGGSNNDKMASGISSMYQGGDSSLVQGLSGGSNSFSNIPGGANSVIGGVTGGINNSLSGLTDGSLNFSNDFNTLNTLENMSGGDISNATSFGGLSNATDLNSLSNSLGGLTGIANISNGIGIDELTNSIANSDITNIGNNISSSLDSFNLDSLNQFGLSSLQSGLGSQFNFQNTDNFGIDVLTNSNSVISGIGSMFSDIGTSINSTLSSLAGNVTDPISGITNGLSSSINGLTSNSGIDSLFGNLMNGFGVTDISSELDNQLNSLPNNLLSGVGGLNDLISTVTSPITAVNSLANSLTCTAQDIVGGLTGSVDLINDTLNTGLSSVLNSISSGTNSVLSGIFGSLDNMVLSNIQNLNISSLFGVLSNSASSSTCNQSNVLNPYTL